MRVDRGFVGWGVFCVVAGAVPLLVNQGLIDARVARDALSLWPLFIVAVGLGLLLRDTPIDWLGGLVAVTTAGAIAGSVLVWGVP